MDMLRIGWIQGPFKHHVGFMSSHIMQIFVLSYFVGEMRFQFVFSTAPIKSDKQIFVYL